MKVAELEDILADHAKILAIVKDECLRMRDKYGDERRTEISIIGGEVDIEDLIPEEECVLTMSRLGYIKRQAADTFQLQHRGGRGIKGMSTREEDSTSRMFLCNSHDYIMFFTTAGRAYRIKAYEVPEGSRQSKGLNIVNLLPIEGDEKVSAMVPITGNEESGYLCMITRKGIIKRTRLEAFANVRKSGIIAVDLDEGDELATVQLTDGYRSLLVTTHKGMAIRFDENDARVVGRTARGVKALNLAADDEVVGMELVDDDRLLLTVTETGYGRLSRFDEYRVQSRGGKGLTNYHTERYGNVVGLETVNPADDLILISSDGIIIRMLMEEIRLCSRTSKGVHVMRLAEGVTIVSIATAEHDEEEVNAAPEDDGTADEGAEEQSADEQTAEE
jgi:DNA gyrase subunit A